jgi:hypothetical protein
MAFGYGDPIAARSPVFVEDEHIRIVVTLMKIIVNTAGFLPGLHYEILEDFLELLLLFGLCMKIRNDGAHLVQLKISFIGALMCPSPSPLAPGTRCPGVADRLFLLKSLSF